VVDSLKAIKQNLEANLTQKLQDELEQLKADMQDKQATLASYQELMQIVESELE